MAAIHLPFQSRWRPLVLSGAKTTTVRTKRYGHAGDEFEVEGRRFRVVEVRMLPLALARDACWRDEGMASPQEFEDAWRASHPHRGFRGDDAVWLHRFERA